MGKIYHVEAEFGDYDTTYQYTIGFFTLEDDAVKSKTKWESFFESHKNLIPEYPDSDNWGKTDEEYEDIISEIYLAEARFLDIAKYDRIIISEYILNRDIFTSYSDVRSDKMDELVKNWDIQWSRDEKINNIID